MPPVWCCTFLELLSTTTLPEAITAPGERGRRRPRPDAADKQDGHRQAEQDVGPDAFAGAGALF